MWNSRKRGPVSGAGFICIKDEEIFRKLLLQCPSQIPFLEGIYSSKFTMICVFCIWCKKSVVNEITVFLTVFEAEYSIDPPLLFLFSIVLATFGTFCRNDISSFLANSLNMKTFLKFWWNSQRLSLPFSLIFFPYYFRFLLMFFSYYYCWLCFNIFQLMTSIINLR